MKPPEPSNVESLNVECFMRGPNGRSTLALPLFDATFPL